jgi:hypothetical protein
MQHAPTSIALRGRIPRLRHRLARGSFRQEVRGIARRRPLRRGLELGVANCLGGCARHCAYRCIVEREHLGRRGSMVRRSQLLAPTSDSLLTPASTRCWSYSRTSLRLTARLGPCAIPRAGTYRRWHPQQHLRNPFGNGTATTWRSRHSKSGASSSAMLAGPRSARTNGCARLAPRPKKPAR